MARRFGTKASTLGPGLWTHIVWKKPKFEEMIESLSTIARVESSPDELTWQQMLHHDDPWVRMETLRWWRQFKDNEAVSQVLVRYAAGLLKQDERIRDDLAAVFRDLKVQPNKSLMLPEQEKDRDALTKYALKELADMPAAERPRRAAMGLQVFERNACTKCHTTATQTTPLAPSLKGIAAQKVDYLVESVLFPSKVIKTGFEAERIELKNGKVLTGLVKDDGKFLRVLSLEKEERIARADVESRTTTKVSMMPDGQEPMMSRREFVDLILYLQTLK